MCSASLPFLSHQPKVVVTLSVTSPDLFRLVFRHVNRGPANVEGRVSVLEEGKFNVCGNCKCFFHFWIKPTQPPLSKSNRETSCPFFVSAKRRFLPPLLKALPPAL